MSTVSIIQVQKNDEREITEAVKRAVDQIGGWKTLYPQGILCWSNRIW